MDFLFFVIFTFCKIFCLAKITLLIIGSYVGGDNYDVVFELIIGVGSIRRIDEV